MNKRINWLLLTIGLGLCALASVLHVPTATQASAAQKPFIAIYGHGPAVDMLVQPYIISRTLKFEREYPDQHEYLHEGNIPVPPNSQSLELRMFQVTTNTASVPAVVNQVIAAASQLNNVGTIYPDFDFLSYMPDQIVVHGDCAATQGIIDGFGGDVMPEEIIQFDYAGMTTNDCVRLVNIINPAKRVSDFLVANANARSEPNFLTTGFMGGYGIMGSPAAMVPDAPPTSTSGTSPIATRGESVGVYIFDTNPYEAPLPIVARPVVSKPIRIVQPAATKARIPAELPRLPFKSVSGHGTFVATPIVDLAPDSDVSLVHVLNDNGHGTQFDLALAVDWAIKDAFSILNADWNGVVFNYSLGLEDDAADYVKTALFRMLTTVDALNIVQIAATGNESAYESMPLNANLPAIHPDVIGVTAIAPGNSLACYANAGGPGDVAARGGGAPRGSGLCDVDVFVSECRALGRPGCLHGWDPSSPTNYSYGIGTSFAAPHVAAYAAQVIEQEALEGGRGTWHDPASIRDRMVSQIESMPPEEMVGDGILNPWAQQETPTAVGLAEVKTRSLLPTMIALGLLLVGLSAAISLRRIGKRN